MHATPRPWEVNTLNSSEGLFSYQIITDGRIIANIWQHFDRDETGHKIGHEIDRANARLIVAAVNSYDAMREALEFTTLAIKTEKTLQASRGESIAAQLGLADEKIQAALALADGKEGGRHDDD